MLGAGLVAKKACELGLECFWSGRSLPCNIHINCICKQVKPWVKTSLAPGSGVVSKYLFQSGLQEYLNQHGFNIVGYGCTTCIGNSGDLHESVTAAITDNDIVAAAVLSGNRNFEGRVHSLTRANYLASPPLVVAYALADTFVKCYGIVSLFSMCSFYVLTFISLQSVKMDPKSKKQLDYEGDDHYDELYDDLNIVEGFKFQLSEAQGPSASGADNEVIDEDDM
ncbi:hypothetical protein AgCh_019430 [Apium graveolens]